MSDRQDPQNAAARGEHSAPAAAATTAEGEQSHPSPAESSVRATDKAGIPPPEHWQELQQNTVEDDDSALGDDFNSSTASITSTILQYRTLHGRTFHSEHGNAQYWASNDAQQNESMDVIHHTLTLALGGKLHLAPLDGDRIKKALDVGTGTGIWAIDFADTYHNVEVIGTEISPIQPTWVPPNLKFEIEDCTQPWTFEPASFDYVHMRWLLGSIDDWAALFQRASAALKPGGYLESFDTSALIESDDYPPEEFAKTAMAQWGKFFVEGGKKFGRSFSIYEDDVQVKAMEAAGFVDIQKLDLKVPIGGWPKDPKLKELGRFAELAMKVDVEGYVLFMANTAGWTREEILVYIAQLRRECLSLKYHPHYKQRVVWGRKPSEAQ